MQDANQNLTKIYSQLDDLKADFRNKNLINLISNLVTGESVLEIGCGNGILLSKLKKMGKKTLGLEPSKELFEIAKKNNPDLEIVNGRAEQLGDLIQEKFDSVLMIDVLEHIEDDNGLVQKIYNVLNEKGEYIIVVPAYQFAYGKRDKSLGHYRRYSKKSLKKVLEKNNFVIEKIRYWNMLGLLPYLIAEKIFKKALKTEFRTKNKNFFSKIISKLLDYWFRFIENKINCGFGLSLICVAKKK